MKSLVQIFRLDEFKNTLLPVLTSKVEAGGYGNFESTALDFPDDKVSAESPNGIEFLTTISYSSKKECCPITMM